MYSKCQAFNPPYNYSYIEKIYNDSNELVKINYCARILENTKRLYLGKYKTEEEAKKAVDDYILTGQRKVRPSTRSAGNRRQSNSVITTLRRRISFEKRKLVNLLSNIDSDINFELVEETKNNIIQLEKILKELTKTAG